MVQKGNFRAGLANYDDKRSLGSRLRQKRSGHVRALIDHYYDLAGRCRILDIGGEERYWNIFDEDYLRSRNVSIVLLNRETFAVGSDLFTSEAGDGCDMRHVADGAFDLAHSNSVIEHVGDWSRMEAFAREVRRVAASYYVQTPYFWFPIEPHFRTIYFQLLPEPVRAALFLRFRFGRSAPCQTVGDAVRRVQYTRLLDHKEFSYLFPDAIIRSERFLMMTKSLMAVRQ